MKLLNTINTVLFVIILPLFLLSASIAAAFNLSLFYQYGFEKYNISQVTGLEKAELKKAADGLISYFNSNEELINVTVIKDGKPFTLFNQREVGHLKDVKALVRLDYNILIAAFIAGLAFIAFSWWRRDMRRLAQGLVWGGGLTLAVILSLGLMAFIDFDRFFLQFHLLSFANDLWQLDPASDYLIMLFPQGFWSDATFLIGALTVAGAVVLGGVGMYMMKHRDT